MTTSIVDRLLAGNSEAEKEYRQILALDLSLDPAFVDRVLSPDNIAKLKEAKGIGIHPDSILTLCQLCASSPQSTTPMLTPSEAKEAIRELRKMKRVLRRLLPQTVFAMSEPPTRGQASSPLALASPTAPRLSLSGRFSLLGPHSMNTLWEAAGRNKDNGLLGDLADALEETIPALQAIKPRSLSTHLGKHAFAGMWDALARQTAGRPCHALGGWFLAVTFGTSPGDDAATAFRMLVKRSTS